MSNPSDKQIEEAFRILGHYERSLMQKMASEIVDRKEDFESPFVGVQDKIVRSSGFV